ncbi:hypothetical protein B0H14DRAFT_2599884 [Mycena olivaceomarginata]|nr:hypothetical protein B0H14DRAFT_2599884 [Mycena olivaceomarginata]
MFATADSSGIVSLYSASTGHPGLEWYWGNILEGIGSTACGGSRTLNKKFGHWGEKVCGKKNRLKLVAGDWLDAVQVWHQTQSSACDCRAIPRKCRTNVYSVRIEQARRVWESSRVNYVRVIKMLKKATKLVAGDCLDALQVNHQI